MLTKILVTATLFAAAFGLQINEHHSRNEAANEADWKPSGKHDVTSDVPVVNSNPKATYIRSDGSKPIFYCVIMGQLAYRHQVSVWLSSVRKLGQFKDETVIVTDRPTCLAKTLSEAGLLGDQISTDDNVDIYKPGAGYAGNLHIVKRPHTGNVLKMKLEKARAWRNIEVAKIPHKVSSIVYTDEDVVIAKDLTNFMGAVKELEQKKYTLALFRDTGASAGELHTGVVVIFPGFATENCLQHWGKKLTHIEIGSTEGVAKAAPASLKVDTDESSDEEGQEDMLTKEEMAVMGPDQQALHATTACKAAPDGSHNGIKILPKEFFWLPKGSGMRNGKTVEFVHFTNTGRFNTLGKDRIREYMKSIGVPEHIDPKGHVQDKACADDLAAKR